MYRERLHNLNAKTEAGQRLKNALLDYNEFRTREQSTTALEQLDSLTQWQSQRLRDTHADLYQSPNYQKGIDFLFSDLYAAQDFNDRDQDLERIAPKLVKLLPDKIIATVAQLIELNLLTQRLDLKLAKALFDNAAETQITDTSYCAAYRVCDNHAERRQQLQLISKVGELLDRYAHSRTIQFSLRITETPAEMAGLSALHNFISRGFRSFHDMENIPYLMQTLMTREAQILDNIFNLSTTPFAWSLPHD